MFVVWGTHKKVKRVGYAADFCGICHDLQTVRIDRIGAASHVYGLSMGQGHLVGHLGTCMECGTAREIDPTMFRELSSDAHLSTTDLQRQSCPDFEKIYAERLAVEASLRAGRPIPNEAREALLREPFYLLNADVEAVYEGSSRIDKPALVSIIAMIALPIATGSVVDLMVESGSNAPGMAALTTFGLGLVAFMTCLVRSPGRFVRLRILPKLGRGLAPLAPDLSEIEEVHQQLRTLGLRIARKLRPPAIEQAVADARDEVPAPDVYDFTRAPRSAESAPVV